MILDEEPRMTEIWYTPHDENRIEEIFEAMKHCQSLHPDPNGLSSIYLNAFRAMEHMSIFFCSMFKHQQIVSQRKKMNL